MLTGCRTYSPYRVPFRDGQKFPSHHAKNSKGAAVVLKYVPFMAHHKNSFSEAVLLHNCIPHHAKKSKGQRWFSVVSPQLSKS